MTGYPQRFWERLMGLAVWSREERCGFLYNGRVLLVRNVSPNPTAEYAMNPSEQVAIMTELGWPDLVWHTHPGGRREPSTLDHSSALPGVPYAIAVPGGWAGVWRDGQQIGEAFMTGMTNDIVETFEDGDGYSWRRSDVSGRVLSRGGVFDTVTEAAENARTSNPDVNHEPVGGSSSESDAVNGAGTGGGNVQGGADAGSTGPGSGVGSNASGVGPTGP